jgi:hypothetical protein
LAPAVLELDSTVPPGVWGTIPESRPHLAGGFAQFVGGKRKECTDPTRLPPMITPANAKIKYKQ